MQYSETIVAIQNGGSYLQKLCEHWENQFVVETSNSWGRILLPQTICKLVATPSSLLIQLEVEDDVDQQEMERVIEDHLRGLTGQNPISVAWRRR